jgi:hypothetical protein
VRVFRFADEAGDVVEGVEDGLGVVRHCKKREEGTF